MKKLTEAMVRRAVKVSVKSLIEDMDGDSDRELVIERLDKENDSMWGNLVKYGMITDYDVDDLIETVGSCGVILAVAKSDAWVEDDNGLWDGLTFGIIPSIAFFSLRNLLYQACKDKGVDTNVDLPMRAVKAAK